MIKITYRPEELKIIKENGVEKIFDNIRKRWLVLTPEEWVRQNILQYFVYSLNYPAKLLAIEKEIMLGSLKKRCDIVLYDRDMKPWMIVECKEMNAVLDHKVVDQVLRYHISLPCAYLVMTNGNYCYGFRKERGLFVEINEFPQYG